MAHRELVVCYRDLDGQWLPFMHFARRELGVAVRTVRNLAHGCALKAEWMLRRKRKVILRVPQPKGGC